MNKRLILKKEFPFPFILEELLPVRPIVKQVFGFTHIYLDETLLCSLRDSAKQPATNGMWVYTSTEHLEGLRREFPQLSKRYLWRSGKNGWVILASKLEHFEEYAYKACELILNGDRRIGRMTRGKNIQPKQMKYGGGFDDDRFTNPYSNPLGRLPKRWP